MSFYDDASIVLIPSGYKTSKLYSQKPTDGSGDLTFTRTGSTATRVNDSGLIERCRTNQMLRSEQFNEAFWGKTRATVTADATASPIGTNTADKLVEDTTATTTHFVVSTGQNIGAGGVFSIYAKAGERSRIGIRESTTTGAYATFNLSTGAVIESGSGASGVTITNVGNGWYRLQMVYSTSSNVSFAIFILDNSYTTGSPNSYTYTGDGTSGLFVWGAQLELGDIATDYIPTTTAAVTVGPIANLPRLDYTGGGCPKLLMEPTRTNLILYSQQINNSAWAPAGGTVTANTAISPSGYQDADTLTGGRYQSGGASNTYTLSCFAKKVDGNGRFILRADTPGVNSAVYDLNNGIIVSTPSGFTSSIIPYGNGWYRCILTTPAATTISNFVIVSADGGSSSTYVYGAQLESGSYATSYIPTFNASVTRNVDNAIDTGISSLIGQTQGTILFDLIFTQNTTPSYLGISDGTTVNRLILGAESGVFYVFGYGSATLSLNLNQRYKIALSYNSTNMLIYINGQLTHTITGTIGSNLSQFRFDSGSGIQIFQGLINQVLIFKTRLSNSDLATLTTL